MAFWARCHAQRISVPCRRQPPEEVRHMIARPRGPTIPLCRNLQQMRFRALARGLATGDTGSAPDARAGEIWANHYRVERDYSRDRRMPMSAAFPCCRDHDLFAPVEEYPNNLRRTPGDEAYWFGWDSSFDGKATRAITDTRSRTVQFVRPPPAQPRTPGRW